MTISNLLRKEFYGIRRLFGDDYYLELQRHQTFKENANRDVYPLQVKVNDFLVEMGKKHGIKVVATNDVHFANEDDADTTTD